MPNEFSITYEYEERADNSGQVFRPTNVNRSSMIRTA